MSATAHTITVTCDQHYKAGGKPAPWTITKFMRAIDQTAPSSIRWREMPATHRQVASLIRRRREEGSIPGVTEPGQVEAAEWQRQRPSNVAGGSKTPTRVYLLDDRPLEPGQHLTEADTYRIATRYDLRCEKCENAGKSAPDYRPFYRSEERLWLVLDMIAAAGIGHVNLPMLHLFEKALSERS